MTTVQAGDVLQWSLTNPTGPTNWWGGNPGHRLYCRSVSSTKDIWVRADLINGVWSMGSSQGTVAGIAYYHASRTWQDEDPATNEEPHTPLGFTTLGGTTSANINPEFVRIQISNVNAPSLGHLVWITSPYYSSGSGGGGNINPLGEGESSSGRKNFTNFW